MTDETKLGKGDRTRPKLLLLGDPVVDTGKHPTDDVADNKGHYQQPDSASPREDTYGHWIGHEMQTTHPIDELLAHATSYNQNPNQMDEGNKPSHRQGDTMLKCFHSTPNKIIYRLKCIILFSSFSIKFFGTGNSIGLGYPHRSIDMFGW